MKASVLVISLLGLNFIFRAQYLEIFIFLLVMFGSLMVFDNFTRVRISRVKQIYKSSSWKSGLMVKTQIMITMGALAIIIYFLNGALVNDATNKWEWISTGACLVLIVLMGMYVVGELSSIVENQIEYAKITKQNVNPTTRILAKLLGVAYHKLEDTLKDKTKI